MDSIIVNLVPYVEEVQLNNNVETLISAMAEFTPPGISMINAPIMWSKGITGQGVKVAVIDTGCQSNHPDFAGQIIGGRNFTTEDNSNPAIYEDYNGHGTHVCGTIAANLNAGGVVGVAPNAKLLVLKALTRNGGGTLNSVVSAINYAVAQRVDIISMSLGTAVSAPELYNAIKNAVNNNIIVVCAAGNSGDNNAVTDEIAYPGAYNEVVCVGAIDTTRRAATFSNSNKQVDIVAPGVQITSTFIGSTYRALSGTSMATPHISGALALIIEWARKNYNRNITECELYAQLLRNLVDLKLPKSLQGNGMVFLNL